MFYSPRRSLAACHCGHGRDTHRHYRRGSDCALCACPRWAPERAWQRLGLLRPRPSGRTADGQPDRARQLTS
jgi:hypothetical protein